MKAIGEVVNAINLFYDGARRRIYAACGEGFIDVIEQRDVDDYKLLERISTAPGARTCFFAPDLNQLYLAVPRLGERPAEIRVYQGVTDSFAAKKRKGSKDFSTADER